MTNNQQMVPSSDELEIGKTYDNKFTIEEKIGRGAMGHVYRAHSIELDVPVALKVPTTQIAVNDGYRKRFIQEGEIGKLDLGAYVVKVLDAGEFSDGRLYIAQEFIDNVCDLKRVNDLSIEESKRIDLSYEEVLDVARQAMRGLYACHQKRIVHRDVKADNLLYDRVNNRVKLCDFGVARDPSSGQDPTATGQIMGSPAWMAPEQALGIRVGTGADLFGVGSMLYKLLTGMYPYDAKSAHDMLKSVTSMLPPDVNNHFAEGYVEELCQYQANPELEKGLPPFALMKLEAARVKTPPSLPPITENPVTLCNDVEFLNAYVSQGMLWLRELEAGKRVSSYTAFELMEWMANLQAGVYYRPLTRDGRPKEMIEKFENAKVDSAQDRLKLVSQLATLYEAEGQLIPPVGYESLMVRAADRKAAFEKALEYVSEAQDLLSEDESLDARCVNSAIGSAADFVTKAGAPFPRHGAGRFDIADVFTYWKRWHGALISGEEDRLYWANEIRLDLLEELGLRPEQKTEYSFDGLVEVLINDAKQVPILKAGEDYVVNENLMLNVKMRLRSQQRERMRKNNCSPEGSSSTAISARRLGTTSINYGDRLQKYDGIVDAYEDLVEEGVIPKPGKLSNLEKEVLEALGITGLPAEFKTEFESILERVRGVGRVAAGTALRKASKLIGKIADCDTKDELEALSGKVNEFLYEKVPAQYMPMEKHQEVRDAFMEALSAKYGIDMAGAKVSLAAAQSFIEARNAGDGVAAQTAQKTLLESVEKLQSSGYEVESLGDLTGRLNDDDTWDATSAAWEFQKAVIEKTVVGGQSSIAKVNESEVGMHNPGVSDVDIPGGELVIDDDTVSGGADGGEEEVVPDELLDDSAEDTIMDDDSRPPSEQ